MQGNLEINKKEGLVMVSVNPKIYPLDVVLSSGYIFLDNCYVLIDGDPEEEIIVELRPKKTTDLESLGRDFNNELVSYANYAVQAIKNERLREAIINRVMQTNSVDVPETESKPWFDDPEGIAVPWEEKYGDKAKTK